ncbi:MFS transporter [Fulvimonas soli]|jgi:FSR family fosmidomycin resistance protein-like MFS transporter|uniref:FSR family fosmidomycin resistance protein-like MFS transporter n=1 Tax=Fulvimonas soli TaxID=155197 RepID=A0A316II81_9GAMM|nr:MFS transporter [Fulvimonas soli]PWK92879.1 FSR family fosmidomycin resistance protein-like MFS transporter [Fulvimonas soli]TNY26075.1 MFS transporter [Fulvimonas soli]
MDTRADAAVPAVPSVSGEPRTAFAVLGAISFAHLLNDMIQSLILAIYPLLKSGFGLSFAQVGLITLTYQLTASLLQPLVGLAADRRPMPFSLPVGMGFTLCGLLLLAIAPNFPVLLLAAALVGTGSSVFHPESSRVARLASGGRHGLAQSLFQVGGNTGASLGPLLAAWIIVPHGRGSVAWFALAALLAMVVLLQVGRWYRAQHAARGAARHGPAVALSRGRVAGALAVLGLLIFSKYFYLASISSYYTFYLIHAFGVSVQNAQAHLFVFLFAVAAGSLIGGPVGDRIGRKWVIWASILGVAPFTLLLPHANLFWTGALTVAIGLVLSSAFSAILVYAQELIPGRVGMVSGLFFGFAFGMGGIGAAVLGHLADLRGIDCVYRLCAWLPLMGLVTVFLPDIERPRRAVR